MIQIDLGEISEPTSAPVRAVPVRLRARLAAALVGVVALLALSASAVPNPPSFRLSFQFAQVQLSVLARPHGYLINDGAVDIAGLRDGHLHVTSYALEAAARQRWDALLGPAYDDMAVTLRLIRDVLLVTTGSDVVGLDPATGERLWSQPGRVVADDDQGHVILGPAETNGLPSGGTYPLTAIDAITGRTLWTVETPSPQLALASDGDGRLTWPARIVSLGGGVMKIVDSASGRTLAARSMNLSVFSVQWLGSVIIVAANGSVFGLDTGTLATRWSYPRTFVDDDLLDRCRQLWCGSIDVHVVVVDPATGTVNVRTVKDPDPVLQNVAPAAVTVGGWTPAAAPDGSLRLVDPITLHVAFRLPGWHLLLPADGQVGDAMVVRDDRWVGVVATQQPRLIPLGRIPPDETAQCVASNGYLTCWSDNAIMRIWRYPS